MYMYLTKVHFSLCAGINLEYLKYSVNEISYQLVDMAKPADM